MDFLQTQLAKAKNYRHICVFFHQLLWWSPDNEYASYQPNSLDGRSPEINFWDEVMPLFSSCGRPVYCFAGDVGAHGLSPSFFTDRKNQVYLLASGMGHQVKDNYLLVTVDKKEKVTIQAKWIQNQELQPIEFK